MAARRQRLNTTTTVNLEHMLQRESGGGTRQRMLHMLSGNEAQQLSSTSKALRRTVKSNNTNNNRECWPRFGGERCAFPQTNDDDSNDVEPLCCLPAVDTVHQFHLLMATVELIKTIPPAVRTYQQKEVLRRVLRDQPTLHENYDGPTRLAQRFPQGIMLRQLTEDELLVLWYTLCCTENITQIRHAARLQLSRHQDAAANDRALNDLCACFWQRPRIGPLGWNHFCFRLCNMSLSIAFLNATDSDITACAISMKARFYMTQLCDERLTFRIDENTSRLQRLPFLSIFETLFDTNEAVVYTRPLSQIFSEDATQQQTTEELRDYFIQTVVPGIARKLRDGYRDCRCYRFGDNDSALITACLSAAAWAQAPEIPNCNFLCTETAAIDPMTGAHTIQNTKLLIYGNPWTETEMQDRGIALNEDHCAIGVCIETNRHGSTTIAPCYMVINRGPNALMQEHWQRGHDRAGKTVIINNTIREITMAPLCLFGAHVIYQSDTLVLGSERGYID